jgi:hypothetical protein
MVSCSRCLSITDSESAYCGTCGRPRIAESLRAPFTRPEWQIPLVPLQQLLLVVLALWLAITIGVAFLREFKAVRDSEKLLAENLYAPAWERLSPFVADHPEHDKGLLLCGKATIQLGLFQPAEDCLTKLTAVSPEMAKQLADDYRDVLSARARSLACSADAFRNLLAEAGTLGPSFAPSVLGGIDGVIETCRAARNEFEAWQFGTSLVRQGLGVELVAKGYVPALARALAQGRYADARAFAVQAEQINPARATDIEAVLDGERRKTQATIATLRSLCENLRSDAHYRQTASWCFPAGAPAAVLAAKDGWGKTVVYGAQDPPDDKGCRQGFVLASYGVNGEPSAGKQTPAAGIACRFSSGIESWQLPNRFWLAREGR